VAYREPIITQQPTPTNLFRFAGSSNTWSVTAKAGCRHIIIGTRMDGDPNCDQFTYSRQSATNNSQLYPRDQTTLLAWSPAVLPRLTVVPAPSYPYGQRVLTDNALAIGDRMRPAEPLPMIMWPGNSGI